MKKRNTGVVLGIIGILIIGLVLAIDFNWIAYGSEVITKQQFVTQLVVKIIVVVIMITIISCIVASAYRHGIANGELDRKIKEEVTSFKGNGNTAFLCVLPDYNKKEIVDEIRNNINKISNNLVIREIDVQYDVHHAEMQLRRYTKKENYEQHFSYLISNPCHIFIVNSPRNIDISKEIIKFIGEPCYNDIYGKRVLPEENTMERELPKKTRKGFSEVRCVAYVSSGNNDALESVRIVDDLLLTRKYK